MIQITASLVRRMAEPACRAVDRTGRADHGADRRKGVMEDRLQVNFLIQERRRSDVIEEHGQRKLP
jgi:hypothetical protein